MFQTLVNSFKNKTVRNKIFLTLFLLLIYRLGSWLPVPGIDADVFTATDGDTFLGLLNAITGGALQNGAFLAIGIAPYINASIIIQLLTVAIPPLERLSKRGEEGRQKITQLTRYFTLLLAFAQSIGIVITWSNSGSLDLNVFGAGTSSFWVGFIVVVLLVGGTAFTMWLGEKITDIGVGNGISLLIFTGIISSAGLAIVSIFSRIVKGGSDGNLAVFELIGFIFLVVSIFLLVVFVDSSVRKVPIHYAKQIKGRKQYGGQNTHIPVKLNANGVLPIIFAMSLLTFPQLLMSIFWKDTAFYNGYINVMGPAKPLYYAILSVLIFGFSYFYAAIQFNPEEVARNIQTYGGFIQGIRPGKPTADYLAKISNRLTLFGAFFLTFVAIVPSIIFSIVLEDAQLVNAFSATGLLIVVSVALEFDKQLESQLMMKHYKGFLK
ncbi:MAG: preprotein translocase subunit SecY [Firmicutes bacterium]|nr:preprotein translocase subunit SecY [Bacillota bacterium]MCL1954193.1 preprotein translocase subunit SecY [Bacillota bacterium]